MSSADEDTQAIRQQMVDNQAIIDELNEKLGRKNQEVRIIQQISEELNSTLELDRILEIILDAMDSVLGFRHCMVLLADDPEEALTLAACRGYDHARIGATIPVGQGVFGVVARRRRIMRMGNVRSRMGYLASVRQRMEATGQGGEFGEVAELPGLPDVESQIGLPLVVKDRLIGVFGVESAQSNAFDELDELLLSIVANQVANAIDNARLHRSVIERSEALDAANAELSQLNESLEGKVTERTAELSSALGEVEREKELSQALLRRMAPPAVIPLMLENKLSPRRLGVTILFTDLVDFTAYASGMEPDEAFALLNDYFSWAGEIIQRYRGYVNKINGDGIMALFGVPFESPTHRTDAAMAALALQSEIAGRFPFKMRIGINSGMVTAGMLGPENKTLYDVLGDAANVASRMEGICPVGSIALTARASEPIARYYAFEALGDLDVKGIGAVKCVGLEGLVPLAEDARRIDPTSRFAQAHLAVLDEIETVKRERLSMVDLASIQARDAAFQHDEAVAAFAAALHDALAASGADLSDCARDDLILAALLHDVGKHAVEPDRLNAETPAHDERARLARDIRDHTLAALDQLELGHLKPMIEGLYALEEANGAAESFAPAAEMLAAANIYDSLTAPTVSKGAPWRVTGALEELGRLPYTRAKDRPVFMAFVELMKPADATLATRTRDGVVLR